ncbi:hypothetical protein HPB47_012713 [Ixodes persulcatus]|uniref:Uncharacterized protein n=1 Tax=Ixodes persulcatus TaxID=34615 RepID=A0AC60NST3_IXOPE|nr:hypothetical protein HPB47_012713 [Ixodes persulcatus]
MMPKKKESAASSKEDAPIDVIGLPSHKRHKKHKHKKHKRKRGTDQDEDQSPAASPQSGGEGSSSKPALKLKIKIGGQTVEKNVTKVKQQRPPPPDPSEADLAELLMKPNSGDTSADSDDEEEAWLEALESGRLEEVDDELRKMKDPTLMTARQRALLESKSQKDEVSATGMAASAEPVKEMSEEMIQRRMLRAKKRKQQAEEKKEKEKKQTIERLLKKSDSRLRASKKLAKKSDTPKVSLVNTQAGTLLSFPVGVAFPLSAAVAQGYPEKTTCGIKGCRNPKKYSCSKTGVPLCSLECYKTNMLQMCV